MSARKVVRLGFPGLFKDATEIDYGHIVPTPEDTEREAQLRKDIRGAVWGVWVVIAGALVAGFGDLIGDLVGRL